MYRYTHTCAIQWNRDKERDYHWLVWQEEAERLRGRCAVGQLEAWESRIYSNQKARAKVSIWVSRQQIASVVGETGDVSSQPFHSLLSWLNERTSRGNIQSTSGFHVHTCAGNASYTYTYIYHTQTQTHTEAKELSNYARLSNIFRH